MLLIEYNMSMSKFKLIKYIFPWMIFYSQRYCETKEAGLYLCFVVYLCRLIH